MIHLLLALAITFSMGFTEDRRVTLGDPILVASAQTEPAECVATFDSKNNTSDHDTDLLIVTEAGTFTMFDVETGEHVVRTANVTLVDTAEIWLRPNSPNGRGKYVTSLGGQVMFQCENEPTTTTTTVPDTTTTTQPETTTTTVPETTTTMPEITTTTQPETTTTTVPDFPSVEWECENDAFNLFLPEGDWQIAGLNDGEQIWYQELTVWEYVLSATGTLSVPVEFAGADAIRVTGGKFDRIFPVETCDTTTTTQPIVTTSPTPDPTTPDTLPHTGASSQATAGFALVAGLIGLGLMKLNPKEEL